MAATTVLSRLSTPIRLVATAAVLALIAAAALVFWPEAELKTLTVDFPRTVSLYEGSDVRILGVSVGTVDTVEPQGTTVEVTLSYDAQYDVPADAQAVIVSPAIVGDRYVQLTPVYTGGEVMPDGASLDASRTAVPVELDEIYSSLDRLSVALGPRGANRDGSLSDLIDASAANLDGSGAQLRQTIHDLALLSGTLSNNKDALFDSITQVQRFVHALAVNDAAVRRFNASLADVSVVLAGERRDLAAALKALGRAMGDVRGFVEDNREILARDIAGLARVTKVLVKQRDALAEIVDVAPVALSNLVFAYNEHTGTLDTRGNLEENIRMLEEDPQAVLCAILEQADNPAQLCEDGELPIDLPRTAPFGQGAPDRYTERQRVDRGLASLVEVDR